MSANFDPSMGNYKNMTPFKMWCQKVLPQTYDDSLTYYEVLCKLKNHLNEVIENMDVLHDDVDALHVAYQQLEAYVNNYFDNLSVQTEINNKLDDMAEDGSLSELIAPFVETLLPEEVAERIESVVALQLSAVVAQQLGAVVGEQLPAEVATQVPTMVTAWLNDHVNPESEVIIDDSLTIQGAAADAKATGDAVGELKSALNNGYYSTHQTWGIGYINGSIGDTYSIVSHNTRRYLVITPTQILRYSVADGYIVQKDEIDANDKITDIKQIKNNVLSVGQKYGLTLRKTDNTDISSLDVETVCPILLYPPVLEKIPILEEKTSVLERSYSKNMFDPNAEGVINGKYLNTSGVPTDGAGWHISGFIKVSGLENIFGSVWSENGSYFAYCKLNYMHSYDEQFNHLAKIWDQSSNGKYEVGSNITYIKFCWNDNEVVPDKKIMLESGTSHSSTYVPYKETNYLEGSAYPTFAETEEMIANSGVIPSDDIVCWGDSLTYSQYASDDAHRYPYLLGVLSGRTVYNWGMPGANSDDIGGLQGGLPIYLDPFTMPATSSDSVVVTLRDANMRTDFIGLLHHSPRGGWVNDIQGMGLAWKIENEDVSLFYSSPYMKVRRKTTAEEATVYSRPIKISSQHNYAKRQIQIFWVGTNDAPNTTEKAQRTVRQVKQMVDFYGGDRYLVLGMTVKAYADECNDLFAQTFGNHYVNVKYYLINYGLSDNGITPTAQDETDIANGVVPTSLRYDSVHFNDYGYNSIAICVHQHGKDLGYWGDAE